MPGPLNDLASLVCADDFARVAHAQLPPDTWAYLAGGAADERTLRDNTESWGRQRLSPHILTDFSEGGSTSVTLLGRTWPHPIAIAPTAFHRLVCPEGEYATALAAAATGALYVVSAQASLPLETIAQAAPGPKWFQLYLPAEREAAAALLRRIELAGYEALVLTVDAPVNGTRDRERRARFQLPPGIAAVNLPPPPPSTDPTAVSGLCGGLARRATTWTDLDWLRAHTRLPVLLKGVLRADDARRAVDAGLAGLIVSNHGGRTLDTVPSTLEALPGVAAAVAGRVPILVDGGIRRGTDIVKARALGATAVLLGRPPLHALAVGGAPALAHLIRLLVAELEVAMTLCGCPTPDAISPDVLWP